MAGCVVLKYVVWVPLENFFFHSHWTFGAQLIPNVFGVFLDQFYFVVLLYAIEYYRSARASDLRASQLESELSQAQLTALQSQLHPHFLFNTLNSISALMHRDVEAADQMLSRLSDMLRLTLGAGDAQEVRLESELEVLARYLGIMNVRFPDRLATHVHASSEALGEFVPSFLLQPLVENVVRHGLDESSKLTNVHIFADLDPQTLTLRIVDDGRGLPPQQERKEGIGLRNTRRRIERLYGQAGTLRVASGSRGGTEVTIRIPRRPSRPEVASGLVAS
jgi:LytS/YehU family sensor histidine kinase